jgi:phage terminase large subunit-like protein
LIIPGLEARITSLSVGENIRGLRHKSTRPDLIICDDVESLESVKTRDGRNSTFRWFTGDVIPAGDLGTKTVVIGNLLHEDSLVMRLKENITNKKLQGVYKEYPLVSRSKNLWPGKFPDKKSIKLLKSKIGDEISWQREYLLNIVPEEDRVIFKNWIQYYSDSPNTKADDYMFSVTGVDLAISEKESADYTSAVSAHVFGSNSDWHAYVLPSPINRRMNFPQTVDSMKNLKSSFNSSHYLCIENVAYQKALIDHLENQGIPVEGIQVGKQDKRSRLALTAAAVKSGKVLFPDKGCTLLMDQIVNFGIEKHDDLADAFTLMMFKIFERCNQPEPRITFIDLGPSYFSGLSDDRPITLDMKF